MRDLSSCSNLARDRDWPPDEHRWRLLLTAGTGYGIDDPKGAGLAAACFVTRHGAPDTSGLSVVGMMLVARQYARQGLGRRVLQHAMRETEGTPLSLYATRFGEPLYTQLGFVGVGQTVTVRGRFRMTRQDTAVTVDTATADDLPALLRLDAEVFGVDRTLMITRLPAFADHLLIAREGSDLIGYAATWPSTETDVIGPLIARDTATAQALITALAGTTRRPLRTDIDARHEKLLSWLKEHGLDPGVTCTAMVHGIPDLPGDPERRFAPLSLATG
jgi:GNAT superfamily N-acetyltransferase